MKSLKYKIATSDFPIPDVEALQIYSGKYKTGKPIVIVLGVMCKDLEKIRCFVCDNESNGRVCNWYDLIPILSEKTKLQWVNMDDGKAIMYNKFAYDDGEWFWRYLDFLEEEEK